jgi:glutathione peroxidase
MLDLPFCRLRGRHAQNAGRDYEARRMNARAIFGMGVLLSTLVYAEVPVSFYELKTKSLDGKPADLSQFKGKVAVVVNTASQCGYTPQYEGLEKLYEELKDKNVVVLGFPSNDFGGQEPGTAEEIQKFCKLKFGVKFPMFEKVVTKGEGASPVYKFLAKDHGEPKWNFHKYVVGKDGKVKAAFSSRTTPESKELKDAIAAAQKE